MTEQVAVGSGNKSVRALGMVDSGRRVMLESRMMIIDGCMTLEEVGIVLGHAAFESMLRAAGIIDSVGLPMLSYIDDGYMAVMQSDKGFQVIFTPAGQEWIGCDARFEPTPATVAATLAGIQ